MPGCSDVRFFTCSRRRFDGFGDPDVRAAPADIVEDVDVDVGDRSALGLRLVGQGDRGHDLAGLVAAALTLGDVVTQSGLPDYESQPGRRHTPRDEITDRMSALCDMMRMLKDTDSAY
jgi:hypothetical protein